MNDEYDNLTLEEKKKRQLEVFEGTYPEVHSDVVREDIGGLEAILDQLDNFRMGIEHATLYELMGARPPKGFILEGPPGTGKTYIAKYLSNMLGARFVDLPLTQFESKWVGEAEKNLQRHLSNFKAYYGLTQQKVLVFFDEAEEVFKRRDAEGWHGPRVNVLLREMDGLGSTDGVIFGAATNYLDKVDSALLRPGRLDFTIKMPSYDGKMLADVFRAQQHYRNRRALGTYSPFVLSDDDFRKCGALAFDKGLTPADVAEVYRRAVEDKIRNILRNTHETATYNDIHVCGEDLESVLLCYKKEGVVNKNRIGFKGVEDWSIR